MKYLVCDRCREVIAGFDPATIHQPLTADMFLPKEEGRGLTAPFQSQEFHEFKCPYGPHFPINRENGPGGEWIWDGTIQTTEGRFQVPTEKPVPNETKPPEPETNNQGSETEPQEINRNAEPEPKAAYICTKCGRTFSSRYGFNSHQRSHK